MPAVVNPLALLLLGQASLITVRPDSAVACPTPAQINLALTARIPGLLVRPEQAAGVGALVLELDRDGDGGALLRLVNPQGADQLRRDLSAKDAPQDCAALADTVALIVERYFVELDDRNARALDAGTRDLGRRWDLSLAAGWRSGADSDGGLQVLARVDRLLGRRFQLSLSAGMGLAAEAVPNGSVYSGEASVRRMPVELGFWWLRALDPGELQLGLTTGLEITRVSAHWDAAQRTDVFPGPTGALAAGLLLPLGEYTFFRATGTLGMALVRYDFYYSDDPAVRRTVFTAPSQRFYAKIVGELGVALPLTKKPAARP
jgi:hypothetical protein